MTLARDRRLVARLRTVDPAAQFRRQTQVRVLRSAGSVRRHGPRRDLPTCDAEEIGQGEVRTEDRPTRRTDWSRRSRSTPRRRSTKRRTAATCASDIAAKVRQNEHGQVRPLALDVVHVHRQIRNAGANQRLREAAPGLLDQFLGIVPAVEIGVLLRPDDPHAGDGPAVDEVLLVGLVPAQDRLGRAVHPPVLVIGADVMPPRLNAAGEARQHPHPRLRLGLAGQPERGPAHLVHRHALGDQLVPAQQAVDELAGQGIVLETLGVAARLVVQHDDFGAGADLLVVAETPALAADAAAVHPEPQAVRPARGFRHAVVQVPDLQPAGVAPLNPLAIDRIVPVASSWAAACPSARGTAGHSARNSRCCRDPGRSNCCR